MAIDSQTYQNIARAVAAYTQERWVHARLLTGTDLVSSNVDIDPSGEDFTGQLRWLQEFEPTINVPTTAGSSTDGTVTDFSTEMANYIKCVRAFGARAPNMSEVVARRNGLTDFAEQYVRSQAKTESISIEKVIQGVINSEIARGTSTVTNGGGIFAFDTDANAADTGAYVDLHKATFADSTVKKLINTSSTGAAATAHLFKAVGAFWKDYEPEFLYIITNPELFADFREKNLVDETRVQDGNMEFTTILNGKFRILPTRTSFSLPAINMRGKVSNDNTKVTVVIAPGALSFVPFAVPDPVEFDRNAKAHSGGGQTEVWYRFGYVVHPNGYDYSGTATAFPSDDRLATAGSWTRKAKALNLGILPIFHV